MMKKRLIATLYVIKSTMQIKIEPTIMQLVEENPSLTADNSMSLLLLEILVNILV